MEFNRLLLKFILCQVETQESSREDNAKFNFLGIIWEGKRSWRAHFSAFKEPKIQNFGNYCPTSRIYWVSYKTPVLRYLRGWNVWVN